MDNASLGLAAELVCFGWGVLALLLGVIKANGRFATILNLLANGTMVYVGLRMHLAFPVVQGLWCLIWIANGAREEIKQHRA
ncbi:hypothetical protein [Streptomyces sp. 769]|uniref:hypothetical protein n=1 Tax=Streptomyces sp. 769 TaxID=1262452 RepID=UPI00057FE6F7|nr:hypothetical protein [Streptomyces sp. 769]AJC53965.1 hypothetical protein GZL_01365 [Streptomyces sp. 769]